MIDKEKEVSTLHKNVVVVNQEDNNPLLSTADASPQNSFVQSSAIGIQSSPTVGLIKKQKNYLVGDSDTIFSGESKKNMITAMQEHLAKTVPGFEPVTINHLSFDD